MRRRSCGRCLPRTRSRRIHTSWSRGSGLEHIPVVAISCPAAGNASIGGEDTLEGRKGDEASTSGLYLKTPKKLENGVTFTYDVTFSAPIEH